MEFSSFLRNRQIDPSLSLMSLNLFNEMICDKLIEMIEKNDRKTDKYGTNLIFIKDEFPHSEYAFSILNTARNEKTYAHSKDKVGNPRTKISYREYEMLLKRCNISKVFNEISDYHF